MKYFSHWIVILTIVVCSSVASIGCGTIEKSSICFDYVNNDVHNYNQSNQITKALENVINIVNGSYCRERITEFLCNYYFPYCENNANITPICEQSCSEYLLTGFCVDHFFNLLNALNDSNYPNVSDSVNGLLQYDCSPPYDITISNNCTLLTSILDAREHVQCIPLTNGTCNTIENYAVDVAQVELHIDLVNALESARLEVLGSDIDPSCITRLDWIICLYKYPPCQDFSLLLICRDDCGELIDFFAVCGSIEEHVNDKTIRDTFTNLRCRVPESYYDGYVEMQFKYGNCTEAPTGLSITSMSPTTNDNIDTDESSSSTDTNNGIIIGAVLGTCIVIFIVMALLMIYCRRNKRKLPNNNLDASHVVSNDQVPSSPTNVSDTLFRKFERAFAGEIIDPCDWEKKEQIGKGAFGIVYKGVYTKETDTDLEVLDVAIKKLQAVDASKTEQFIKECIITKEFDHPNVLKLIGISFLKEDPENVPVMILPFMHNGDVKSFVKSKRGNKLEVTEYPEGLDYNILVKICLDIANGMKYLSSRHFVHRDLAARNCMLDENMIAKVADFGLSRDVYLTDYYRIISKGHNTRLPAKWLAPEALIDRVFTTQSDVWSFGVTCWEIFKLGQEPYPSVDKYDMVNYLKSGNVLDKPFLSSDKMYEIMKSCWKFAPDERPTFSRLVDLLHQHPVECHFIESDE